MTLADYITANLDKRFAWGLHDCVLFAANWLQHATGRNYLSGFPEWSSRKQALRIIKKAGGLENAVDERLTRINPNLAKDGDIAMHNGCMCIFSGPHIVGPGIEKLEFFDRMNAQCAWSY